MDKKLFLVFFLIPVFIVNIHSNDVLIEQILYKKTIVNYDQPVLINVILNEMNVVDIAVYFNGEEIKEINKNFNSYVVGDKNYSPSFSFEADNLLPVSRMELYVTLTYGIIVNIERDIYFKKGMVIENHDFHVSENKKFFIKAGKKHSTFNSYIMEINNSEVLQYLDEIEYDNNIYYKLQSLNYGTAEISIFNYDSFINKKEPEPIKIIKINVD